MLVSSTSRTASLRSVRRDFRLDFCRCHGYARGRRQLLAGGLHASDSRRRKLLPQQGLDSRRLKEPGLSGLFCEGVGKRDLDGRHGRTPGKSMTKVYRRGPTSLGTVRRPGAFAGRSTASIRVSAEEDLVSPGAVATIQGSPYGSPYMVTVG